MMRSASHAPLILARIGHAAFSLLRLVWWGVLPVACVHAQSLPTSLLTADPTLKLKSSPLLAEKPPEGPGNEVPTFVFGELITGRTGLETVLQGSAELRRGTKALRADRVEYYQPDDTVKTRGHVRVSSAGNLFWGPELSLKIDTFEGTFVQPSYRFVAGGNGEAERIDFLDEKRFVARLANYTTCERDNEASWAPAWQMTGQRFNFDFDREVGEATGATVRFMSVPILHWPGTLSFALSDKRKSGVLPPTFGLDTTSGTAITLPYYLDIAPNRDATLSPTYMSKRGVNIANEFRYLEPAYRGIARLDYMPDDMLRNADRWAYTLQHSATLQTGIPGAGNVALGLNLNRVSDDRYWTDFPGAGSSLTQRLLANEMTLNWGQGAFSTGFRVAQWQTLQDSASTIVPPYDRLPQLTARYGRNNVPVAGLTGVDWSVEGDYTSFSALDSLTNQPNAERMYTRAQIGRPMVWPAGFIKPKVQLHATNYQFDSGLTAARVAGDVSASRVVPTFSLDTGLQFERDTALFGKNFIQTLEPRAFYVRTPYRDQGYLPKYDSGANTFSFSTIFTENAFVGNDRISDANLLTLGVTSRFLNDANGAEVVRLGVAQRLRFTDQRVTLEDGADPVSDRFSDLLLGASVNWTREWTMDAATQYNPKTGISERNTLSTRYSPTNYRLITAAYRRERAVSEQYDFGWQWPINDLWGDRGRDQGPGVGLGGGRWYSVGRLNYSVPDRQLVESVVGLEYDGCCWIGRVVLQRSQNSVTTANTKIMVQLEFVGFSRIGNNPLSMLRTQIPRYQFLRDQATPPSRFTNYE
jgi:LPS-assembly protein